MAQSENVFEAYATTSKSMFDFWVSFFPAAPMFGVEWRFGDLNGAAPAPSTKPAKRASKPETVDAKPNAAKPNAAKPNAAKVATPKVVTPAPAAPAAVTPKETATKVETPKVVALKTEAPEAAEAKPVVAKPKPLKVAAKTSEAPEVEAAAKAPKAATKPVAPQKPSAVTKVPAKEPTKPLLLSERPETVDALTEIKGVGPGLEKQLHVLGIYTFDQLIDLNAKQLEWLDVNLKTVKGRCIRDDWTGQAKALKSKA